jgi:NitT/TauT family transport system substrate-binding protein
MKLTPGAKAFVYAIGVALLIFGLKFAFGKGYLDSLIPKGDKVAKVDLSSLNVPSETKIIRVGVVTWGGYVAGQYFNEGFVASKQSRFFKEYGFLVEFKVLDDYVSSRDSWKSNEVDLLWTTVDSFPVEAGGLPDDPKIVLQADWSRGGDAIVVAPGIDSCSDLKGKSVAVAEGTPSHSFLINMLSACQLSYNDVKVVAVASAVDAGSIFRAGQVASAVVWSPDDSLCVDAIPGAKVLKSTKDASFIIADVFYAKEDWIDNNQDILAQFIEGWYIGASEINSSSEAKMKGARILSENLENIPVKDALQAINNTRIVTFGDAKNFFGLNPDYVGVTGKDLYTKMTPIYKALKVGDSGSAPSWEGVVDLRAFKKVNLSGTKHAPEGQISFSAVSEAKGKSMKAYATKRVSINFPTGSAVLTDEAKFIVRGELVPNAKEFANSRIRIEGNTDNVGSPELNKALSLKRARALSSYLITTYKFDPNRFVVVGNGEDKPIADNDSEEGRATNRRTDFELLD